ncbi:MAG: DUF86 domain-containing protein [Gemmatimonadetes bacterium]|nr:DUF86 domain-containing protein [Gemmatimonadota bacterium]
MSFEPREYLRHILDEANYLVEQSRRLDRERFIDDPNMTRAFVRSLEIIGEASKQVPETFRAAYPHVQWRGMARLRDRLIHGYFGVDYNVVWDIIENDIPGLKEHMEAILADSSEESS